MISSYANKSVHVYLLFISGFRRLTDRIYAKREGICQHARMLIGVFPLWTCSKVRSCGSPVVQWAKRLVAQRTCLFTGISNSQCIYIQWCWSYSLFGKNFNWRSKISVREKMRQRIFAAFKLSHGPTIWADKQSFGECSILNPTFLSVLRKHLVIGQFSLFSFSLLFIGHHQSANIVWLRLRQDYGIMRDFIGHYQPANLLYLR